MPLATEHDVQAALAPYNSRIRRAIDRGFSKYVRRLASGPNLWKRTDSVDISDCVTKELLKEFEGKAGIAVFRKYGTVKLLFGSRVVVRFKKGGRNGLGMNAATRANDNFLNPNLPFQDAPHAMKVEICWKLNATGTGCTDVIVAARNGDGALWSYRLPGGRQKVLEFPAREATPREENGRRSIVKLKDGKGKRRKADDAS